MDSVKKYLSLTPAILIIFTISMAQEPNSWTEVTNGLSQVEKDAGWELLFDGADVNANWRSGENGNSLNWTLEDSSMKSPAPGDMVFTKKSYSNFEYKLTWKLNHGGNSGVFFRTEANPGWFCSGTEYGILDEVNGGDRTEMGYFGNETTMPIKVSASCYDFYVTKKEGHIDSPYVMVANPYDEWNSGTIWADGDHVEHWLNGHKVVDYITGSAEWQRRFERSKFWNQCSQHRSTYGKHTSGLLGMQGHGGGHIVWFRNMKVRPFTPGEKLVGPSISPNGLSSPDSVEITMEVAITGAKIYYTTDGSNPTTSSTRYTGPFKFLGAGNETVKAITVRETFATSDPASASYTFPTSIAHRIKNLIHWKIKKSESRLEINFTGVPYEDIDFLLYDIQGQILKSEKLDLESSNINLPRLNKGLYFFRIQKGNYSQIEKIFITE